MWVLPIALLAEGAEIVKGALFIKVMIEEELYRWPGVLILRT